MKLYEINDAILKILSRLDVETGEISEQQFDELTKLNVMRNEKIENTALYIKTLRAERDMIKKERQRLQKKEQAASNRVKSLEDYLLAMLGGENYKSALNNVYHSTSARVEIEDINKVPDEYLTEQPPKIAKQSIARKLKQGVEISGCKLVENEFIVIK